MKTFRMLSVVSAIVTSVALLVSPLGAQTATPTAPRANPRPVRQAAPPVPVRVVQVEQKCLRTLSGACTNPTAVEAARLRAIIIPAVRVSYLGTPAGTIGGDYITFERLFQDNPMLFGLPTFTFVQPCCTSRTK